MSLKWEQVVVNSLDPKALAEWWKAALGWNFSEIDEDGDVEIRRTRDSFPALMFVGVPEAKDGFDRLHLDFRPDDQAAEVERLLSLGAVHTDVGQGEDKTWTVLADPEGNEFCVLSAPA
ncbi:VOC family protein [Rhodococcus sp. G-MC3]|uniref:VOC family protein n=1 Tax=Rhodococcus sp. G-MC3 TaxID=3046209 RepID=UPI0024B931BB|nr:VOC family protein [Rhodococcus sp. G-MC3]MDJ0394804.1 VOC family protein [Rhodococcus sp. G-MC3]